MTKNEYAIFTNFLANLTKKTPQQINIKCLFLLDTVGAPL